jgi:uncharacterized membrane protein
MARPGKEERIDEQSPSETRAGSRPQPKGEKAESFIPSEIDLPEPFLRVLRRYPSLQRHPHPFVVHFPVVFALAAAFFSLLYLGTGVISFDTTAFHCLGAAVLTIPLTMVTGEISRRVNYAQEPKQAFLIERRYSRLLLALSSVAFVWRWLDPAILRNFRWTSLVYLLILLTLPVLVTIISYFGGLLTFPLEKGED